MPHHAGIADRLAAHASRCQASVGRRITTGSLQGLRSSDTLHSIWDFHLTGSHENHRKCLRVRS